MQEGDLRVCILLAWSFPTMLSSMLRAALCTVILIIVKIIGRAASSLA